MLSSGLACRRVSIVFTLLCGLGLAAQAAEPELKTYRNQIEKISARHQKHFVPFRFSYPASWEPDPEAGTEADSNVVKVERDIKLGDAGEFTLENFAIGYCDVSGGSAELVKTEMQFLTEEFKKSFAGGFPEFKALSEGEKKFAGYDGYGFDFSSHIKNDAIGDLMLWGRVILLAPGAIKQEHGIAVVMLASSKSADVKGIDDLGVKGELPTILKSFRIGADDGKTPIAPPKVD